MRKILVEIYLPVLNQSFDAHIPLASKVSEIEILLGKVFNEISNGYFGLNQQIVLCHRENGEILDINKTAFELNLKNGSKLMLI